MMWTLSCHLFFFEWIVLNTFISVHTYTSTAGTFAKSYPPKPVWTKDFDLILWSNLFCKVVTRGKTEEAARSNERKEKQEHMRLQNDVLMYLADVFTCVPRQEFGVLDFRDCVKAVWGRLIMKATCGYFLFSQLYVGFHQDYKIFSRESQPKPSIATGILGGGNNPTYKVVFSRIFFHNWRSKNPRFSTTLTFDFPRKCLNWTSSCRLGPQKKPPKTIRALARRKKTPNQERLLRFAVLPVLLGSALQLQQLQHAMLSQVGIGTGGIGENGDMKKTEFGYLDHFWGLWKRNTMMFRWNTSCCPLNRLEE